MLRFDNLLHPTVSASLVLLFAAAPRAPAQERQALDDTSAGNEISTRTVAQLSFLGLDVAPDVAAHVFRLPGGGWGVSAAVFGGVVQRFDTAGVPAGKFGRSGQGPGELGGQVSAVPMRGELWVVDPENARLSIFSSDLRLMEDRRLEMRPFFVAPARDGRCLLVSGGFFPAEGMRYAVARVSRDVGADVFGDLIGRNAPPMSQWLVRRRMVAETLGGEVWSVAMSGGAVDVLESSDLSLVARLRLPGSELAREARWRALDLDERPAPQLLGIATDSTGLLWLTFAAADRDWTPGMDPREGAGNYFDTRVLAIDPAKRAVVGEVRIDPTCLTVERNLISCVDELGQTIRVVALELVPHGRAER